MNPDLVMVTLVVGLGTWAFRYWPTRFTIADAHRDSLLNRFFASTGPAAIATLCVAALLPLLEPGAGAAPVAIGCAGVVVAFAVRRSVALATIAGAISYGLAFHALAVLPG